MSQNPIHEENLEKENLNPQSFQSLGVADAGKVPETLEEQRDYYLKLYEKWARWKNSEETKIKNPKLWGFIARGGF